MNARALADESPRSDSHFLAFTTELVHLISFSYAYKKTVKVVKKLHLKAVKKAAPKKWQKLLLKVVKKVIKKTAPKGG